MLLVLKTFNNLLIAHPSGSIGNCTQNFHLDRFLPLRCIYAWSMMKNSAVLHLKHCIKTEGLPGFAIPCRRYVKLKLLEQELYFWYDLQECKLRISTTVWKKYCYISECAHTSKPRGTLRDYFKIRTISVSSLAWLSSYFKTNQKRDMKYGSKAFPLVFSSSSNECCKRFRIINETRVPAPQSW